MEPFMVAAIAFVSMLLGYWIGKRQGEMNKLIRGGKQPPLSFWSKSSRPKVIKGGKESFQWPKL